MTDRNRPDSDLDREQRGSSNPNQSPSNENRDTQATETGMGAERTPGQNRNREGLDAERGVGSESEDRGQGNVGSSREGNRSTGNIEGDENLNRR